MLRPFPATFIPLLFYWLVYFRVNASLPFSISDKGQGFTVSIDDLQVLQHSPDSPILYVGTGVTQLPEDSGNFFIQDYITSRIPLVDYLISCGQTNCSVLLSRGETFAVLSFRSELEQPLVVSMQDSSSDFDRVWFRVYAEVDEEVYGGGEQYSYFNLRHREGNGENVFPMWVREQGVGRNKSTQLTFVMDTLDKAGGDYHTSYFPQPTYLSSRRYYLHYNGLSYSVFDFRSSRFHEIFILGKTGSLYFNKASSLLGAVTELTSFLGRMPELPEWLLGGAVLGVQGGTDTMLSRYRQAKAFNIPVAGIWIQDWSGKVDMEFGQRVNWDWRWDPRWYPDLDKVIKNLKQDGVRVLAYINPYLRQNGDMFKEAEALGYLVRNGTGDVYLQRSVTLMFGSVDLTNPSAYSWYKNIIKTNLIGLGMGGWMADFGEYLPVDAVLHDGRSGLEGHNEWPVLWAKLNREALEETGQLGEIVFFTRAGFSGTSKFTTLVWNGDQNVDFSPADGVRSSVYGTLSLGVSGVGLSHFDIGGYTTLADLGLTRSVELLLRSAEMAVFTPVFRTHEGNQPKANAQWYNNNTISSFARLAKQFALLADYRKFVIQQVSRAGVPAQLPVSVVYEGSPSPYSQFLFGSDLLVAPVCEENVQDLWVSLPVSRGYDWVHLWTQTSYKGGQTILVPVPLGQPAVFYRSDSAFMQVFDSLTTTTHTKRLAPEIGFLQSPGRKWRHS